MTRFRIPRFLTVVALMGAVASLAAAPQNVPEETPSGPLETLPQADRLIDEDPIAFLLNEIESLRAELDATRQVLAETSLEAEMAKRELAELRQFMADHREYGQDFQQYRAVKQIAEREARQRQAQAARERREAERAEREMRRQAALAERARQNMMLAEESRYRRSGFTAVGLDVYAGRMAFSYEATSGDIRTRIDYVPGLGGSYLRAYPGYETIDYSSMTISGSVLNGADQVRNIGVAITFFDENGNQVGHEIVQVNNARPDVPYPFTSTINMALNRPFDSSSIYVLYADPVQTEEAPPATMSTNPTPAPSRTGAPSPEDGY